MFLWILLAVGVFSSVVLCLTVLILFASTKLTKQGEVQLVINEDRNRPLKVSPTGTLLAALAKQKILVPSACGGGGTCAMCRVKVLAGAGAISPVEEGHLSRSERKEGFRLACQVKVRDDMDIELAEELFSIKSYDVEVVSNRNVATFIKEIVFKLKDGDEMDFKAGGYIQIEVPEGTYRFKDFDIQGAYREDWDKFNLWGLETVVSEPVERAYSMACHPAEKGTVMLNIRIATPPPQAKDVQPGLCSSYIFSLKAGDKAKLSGPYGEFFINETQREMCYIGGGAGMAPMRSHLFHLFHTLNTNRNVTFWYGARSKKEMFYEEDFNQIAEQHSNFKWNVAMSDPQPEDNWSGYVGFIHKVLYDEFLSSHEDPTEIEYYLCGPPMMISAVTSMLEDLCVEPEMIRYDSFG